MANIAKNTEIVIIIINTNIYKTILNWQSKRILIKKGVIIIISNNPIISTQSARKKTLLCHKHTTLKYVQ